MIKNILKKLKKLFQKPEVEKPERGFWINPLFDSEKDDFERVVGLYNKIVSFDDNKKWEWEGEESIPERYWGLTFSPTFWDMANNYRTALDKRDDFHLQYGGEKEKRDRIDHMLCEPTFYKKYIGEVLSVVTAPGPYFIYEHETYEIRFDNPETGFTGTADEIKRHFDTIRKTDNIVYYNIHRGEIKHGGELIFKVGYVKLDKLDRVVLG